MKACISKENLLKAIQVVYPAIPARSTLPILTHVFLETAKESLRVTGTNLEMGITTSVPAEVVDEGAIALPAKRLYDLLKELPNDSLHVSAKKNLQFSICLE